MKKLVLFDIDKTLIKGFKWDINAISKAVKKTYNVDENPYAKEYSGLTDKERIIKVLEKNGINKKEINSKLKCCLDSFLEFFNEAANKNNVYVLNGVKKLLEGLKKNNVLIGVVTGNIEATAKIKLKKAGLNSYFKLGGFGSDELKRADIAKIAIKRAKEKFNFKLNNNVFLIGDTPNDVKAGKDAGIKVIGIATGIWTEKQLKEAGADFVFKNLKDTEKVLKVIL